MRELANLETVGLNVRADNGAALSLYESLGFARHCRFYEAVGHRLTPISQPPIDAD